MLRGDHGPCLLGRSDHELPRPETGNIELLAKYCNAEQKEKWLKPLMNGEFSSAYSMTEPDRASSDATNIACRMERDGDEYVINGRKLYGQHEVQQRRQALHSHGMHRPTNPDPWPSPLHDARAQRHPWPRDGPAPDHHGLRLGTRRPRRIRVQERSDPCLKRDPGGGRAFEIAQGRLGPGRIHHCMRLIGQCERAYELALLRCIDERKKPRES